ncbi:MAG: alpha/beta fold hydrolase [Deltaproteobacteria bacterium]|nr:alpha/beta fold hydrolase [Deltaproteobacteria bacterium]
MSTPAVILALLGIAWVIAIVWSLAWTRAFRAPDGEVHALPSADGWTVFVHRYRPIGPPRGGPPVVLGHGFTMNRWCWSLSEAGSMPLALSRLGYDVFVAEYRGSGRGRQPDAPSLYSRRPGGFDGWGFDDHVELDLPAIIDGVCAITGEEEVHWVGHSMGGMLGYAYALSTGGRRLASLTTLGSPTRFAHIVTLFGPTGPLAWRALHWLHLVRMRPFLFLALPFAIFAPGVTMRTSGTPEFLNLQERMSLMCEAFEDTSPALAAFFIDHWREDRSLVPGGAGPSFADLPVPTLVVAGIQDRLAPPSAVRVPFDESGGWGETEEAPVAYRLFGDPELPADVAGPPLGHADLISGEMAIQHIVPLLDEWLRGCDLGSVRGLRLHPAALPTPAKAV